MRKRPKGHDRPEYATRREKDGDQKARGKLLWHQTERVIVVERGHWARKSTNCSLMILRNRSDGKQPKLSWMAIE
jgi:hypothetical protein